MCQISEQLPYRQNAWNDVDALTILGIMFSSNTSNTQKILSSDLQKRHCTLW